MGMMETINKFVDTMLEEQQGFETMQNEVSKKEEDVLQEIRMAGKSPEFMILIPLLAMGVTIYLLSHI